MTSAPGNHTAISIKPFLIALCLILFSYTGVVQAEEKPLVTNIRDKMKKVESIANKVFKVDKILGNRVSGSDPSPPRYPKTYGECSQQYRAWGKRISQLSEQKDQCEVNSNVLLYTSIKSCGHSTIALKECVVYAKAINCAQEKRDKQYDQCYAAVKRELDKEHELTLLKRVKKATVRAVERAAERIRDNYARNVDNLDSDETEVANWNEDVGDLGNGGAGANWNTGGLGDLGNGGAEANWNTGDDGTLLEEEMGEYTKAHQAERDRRNDAIARRKALQAKRERLAKAEQEESDRRNDAIARKEAKQELEHGQGFQREQSERESGGFNIFEALSTIVNVYSQEQRRLRQQQRRLRQQSDYEQQSDDEQQDDYYYENIQTGAVIR